MSFLNQLSEKLDAQRVYDGLRGKYETRFKVEGNEYTFLATTLAGEFDDNAEWMIEFENMLSHRIGMEDNNPKVIKAFSEAVDQWVKERNPYSFYTFGSHIDPLKAIINGIKKKVKKYNLIDDTADKKNEDNGEVIEGNPVGKITWTKMLEQEVTTSEKKADTKTEKLEEPSVEAKDVKTPKAFKTGIRKDQLDKGDKAYDFKTESFDEFKSQRLDSINEALKVEEILKKAKSVAKKFKDKFGSQLKSILDVASNAEELKSWLEKNKEDFVNAMDIVKHMIDKKELSFEEEILQGIHLNENLLTTLAKKTPNAILAAGLILTILGSGSKVFAARGNGEDAFKKAKENVEKIVEIVKEQGGKAGEEVKKGAEEVGTEVKKGAEKAGEEVKKGAEEVGAGIQQGAEKAGEKIKAGTEDIRANFKDFIQKKKEEAAKKKEASPTSTEKPKPFQTPQSKYKSADVA